jgi:D-3-phosphoglycerate dehydrogenase / 2-oxoglutarate reductase
VPLSRYLESEATMPRVLVTEPLAQEGLELLRETCSVHVMLHPERETLADAMGGYDGLIVRSRTQVTADLLERSSRLRVIGRPGVGVDNIDTEAATRHGVVVVNAPTATTVAVAEHTLGLMLAMTRNLCRANGSMHEQRWEKSDLVGTELFRKTLGIVGLGRIGSAVAQRARGFEMRIVAYDPFVAASRADALGVELVPLNTLLTDSDYVTLHTPLSDRTRGILGEPELALMRPTAYIINCARGGLLDEEALARALRENRLAGAALDVLSTEPDIPAVLAGCPNLLLSPHLGASTKEAQNLAAVTVAEQVVDVLQGRAPRHPVNVPVFDLGDASDLIGYLDLATQLGRLCAQSTRDGLLGIDVICAEEAARLPMESVCAAALTGLLADASEVAVNMVNARLLAEERGLRLSSTQTDEAHGFAGLVTLVVHTALEDWRVSGAIMRGQPRVVRLGEFWFDFAARGRLLITEHVERPGVIGEMGTLLGGMGVSISFVQVGRQERGGYGLMVLGLDDEPPARMLTEVEGLPSVRAAWLVHL